MFLVKEPQPRTFVSFPGFARLGRGTRAGIQGLARSREALDHGTVLSPL